jgi:NAD(P)-dependent dehydrogenase (short-subunit alcohol dehydrogenase family)
VVVTGGASGIGRAVCLALAQVGRPVAAWDLDAAGARRTARMCTDEHGVPAIGLGVDVTVTAAIDPAVKRSLTALDAIGGLVHAAGIGGPGMVTDVTDESWDAVLDVNLRAGAMLTKALHPALCLASPGSAVVYISSIEGFFGNTFLAAYSASKAGVLGLTRSAAHTLGANGIRVNAVCPGAVDTPLLAPLLDLPGVRQSLEARIPLGRVAQPEDIGRTVRFLLSDDAGYITGASLVVDGGLTAIAGI